MIVLGRSQWIGAMRFLCSDSRSQRICSRRSRAQLTPLNRQIDWALPRGRLKEMQAELRFMIEVDRKRE